MDVRNREMVDTLKKVLWPNDPIRPINVWAVVHSAKDRRIFDLISRCYLDKCCLFAGELSPELERQLPTWCSFHLVIVVR